MSKLVTIAAERGSRATTTAGARAYLLAHLPAPLPLPGVPGRHHSPPRWLPMSAADKPTARWLVSLRRRLLWLPDAIREQCDRAQMTAGAPLTRADLAAAIEHHRREALGAQVCASLGLPTLPELAAQASAALQQQWPYRRSTSRWAGGEHFVVVRIVPRTPAAECIAHKVWSGNNKWSGTNSHATISITSRAIAEFGPAGLIQGGLILLDAERIGPREYRATWVEQGPGTGVRAAHGWLIRGYHSTAPTIERARKDAAKARSRAATLALSARARRHEHADADRAASSVWVSVEDSLSAGNCRPASERVAATVRQHLGGDVGAVRGDVLLRLVGEDLRPRALRAIEAARRAHAH